MIHPYATEAYAKSLGHVGTPMLLPEWETVVVLREIPGGGVDAIGAYPIAVLAQDADLQGGLDRLRAVGVVTVTLVIVGKHRAERLRGTFNVVEPFKSHWIRRNTAPFGYDKHHRYEIRRALRSVEAGVFALADEMNAWCDLYRALVERHNLSGLHDFPRSHFETLGAMAGVTAIGAWKDGALVSAHVWMDDGANVHSHLAASNAEGYRIGAAYAVYDASIRHFAERETLNFGGGAGALEDPADGLATFKKGFANELEQAYICGAILNGEKYQDLAQYRNAPPETRFFPIYRTPGD